MSIIIGGKGELHSGLNNPNKRDDNEREGLVFSSTGMYKDNNFVDDGIKKSTVGKPSRQFTIF